MPNLNPSANKDAALVIKLMLDKPIDEWQDALASTKFVIDIAKNVKNRSQEQQGLAAAGFILNKPAFITDNVLLGEFRVPYDDFIEAIFKINPPESYNATDESFKEVVKEISDAVMLLFAKEKEKWSLMGNLKAKREFTYQFQNKLCKENSLYNMLVSCFKMVLATVAYRLAYDDMDGISTGADDYACMVDVEDDRNNSVAVVEILEDDDSNLDAGQIKILLKRNSISKERQEMYQIRINRHLQKVWSNIEEKVTFMKEKWGEDYKMEKKDLVPYSAIILTGLKTLIDEYFSGKLVRKVSMAKVETVKQSLAKLIQNIDTDDVKISKLLDPFIQVAKIIYEHTLDLPAIALGASDINEDLDTSGEIPVEAKQFLNNKLPFSSAPRIKANVPLKKALQIPKWNVSETTLWEHLEEIMAFCLENQITSNRQKLNVIFNIFHEEVDRREYQEMVLDKLPEDKELDEETFTSIIHKLVFRFDRQNVPSRVVDMYVANKHFLPKYVRNASRSEKCICM